MHKSAQAAGHGNDPGGKLANSNASGVSVVREFPRRLTGGAIALALFVSMLWGGNVAGLKVGLATFPPFWSAFWRMLLGLAVLLAWAAFNRTDLRLRTGEGRSLTLLGLLFSAQIALLNFGTQYSSPAYAVVLVNANPLFANIIGHFLPLEQRLSVARVLGLTIAFGGLCWVMLGEPDAALAPHPFLGNALTAVSACLLGLRMLFTRHLVQSIPPLRAIVWQVAVSLPVFLVAAVLVEPTVLKEVAWPAIAALFYTGAIVAGFCFVMWADLLKRYSAGTLSMFSFTVPFFGIAASAVMFGEPVTARLLVGAVMVTLGIGIVSRV
ncbi:MAG: DMT family transporter [Bryobacteraceae bacterium]